MSKLSYIINKFIEICPEFIDVWQEHLEYWKDDEENRGIFLDMAELARFIVDLFEVGDTKKFSQIFDQVEKYLEGDQEEVVGVISVGLLEDIQTIASNRKFGYKVFEQWLKPKSLNTWHAIEKTWEGKSSLMDIIRDEVKRNI